MNSETYQRGERPPDWKKVQKEDPSNKLLSYFSPRRLTAEELRDGMLFVSGELNLEMGGLPIFPEINMGSCLAAAPCDGSVRLLTSLREIRDAKSAHRLCVSISRFARSNAGSI